MKKNKSPKSGKKEKKSYFSIGLPAQLTARLDAALASGQSRASFIWNLLEKEFGANR